MATLYFQLEKPARFNNGNPAPAGNYYIEGMDGFTCTNDVFKVALKKTLKENVGSMWLQYNNGIVTDLKTQETIEGDALSDFAQAKLIATKWGVVSHFPYGSARFLSNGSIG